MTTEPKIVKRRGKVYVEYDSVGDAFSDVTAYAALRTRLAEAEGHIRGLVAEMDNYRKLWPERRTLRLAPTSTILEQARAFLEGSQE